MSAELFPVTFALAAVPAGETITWAGTGTLDEALTAERARGAPTVEEARRLVPQREWDGD